MGNKTNETLFHVNSFSLSPHVSIRSVVFNTTAPLGTRQPVWSEAIAGQAAGTYRRSDHRTIVDRMYSG